ncbi:M13 family metallopeptidase [Lacrimispora aerotolerans]|uniref:M13 family metallopeptidase n=1 Tax=Lacrimispora aerotolerans TaxID=36832 RepID=UPI000A4CBDEE|nr:M13 family metallopeptidase [Lacrimispora aerotolerans]
MTDKEVEPSTSFFESNKRKKEKGELMKRTISLFLALVLALSFILSGCSKKKEADPEETKAQPVNVSGTAESAQSEEEERALAKDYYDYVNQKVLSEKEIPKDSNQWSYFYDLDRKSYDILDGVLKSAVNDRANAKIGSIEQKIGDYYLTALDMEGRKNAGLQPLNPYIDSIKDAKSVSEYMKALGTVYSDLGVGSLILPQWYEDMKDSSRYALYLNGADIGPGKETLEDESLSELLKNYQAYIETIMESSGLSQEDAKAAGADILAFQKDLAKSALPLSKQGDPEIIYNPYTPEMLKEMFPDGTMDIFLQAAGLSKQPSLVVTEQEQLKKISGYLNEDFLPLLKNYAVFCLINDFAGYLTPEIRDNYMNWHKIQNGIKENKTDEKLASEMTQDMLGFEFGRLYVEKCFSEKDKEAIKAMAETIIDTYKKQIMALDWMGEKTKAAALKKLDHMTLKIGYPDEWPDYYKEAQVLPAEKGGSLIGNTISLLKARNEMEKEKVKKPVDKGEWGMTPQTVNAYYNPTGNEIVFPAAILQPPFYDSKALYASNLGGIGMVIAHEVSHAFDSSGSQYDENGNYHVWWTDEDRAKFKKLASQVEAYYDSQDGYEGRHVNGAQTLNENIADLGALESITSIAGDDKEALRHLFRQYATIWASKYTPEAMIKRLNTDVHSPAKVRVNAVLSATDSFYWAYPEIKETDGMYVPPEKRVKIW